MTQNSGVSSRCSLTTNLAQSLNISEQKFLSMRDSAIWRLTLTSVYGKLSHSTMYTIRTQPKSMYTRTQPNRPFGASSKVTTQQYLLMVKLVRERHTLWRVSNTRRVTRKEELSHAPWRRFSVSSRCSHRKTPHSWSELVIFKSITR